MKDLPPCKKTNITDFFIVYSTCKSLIIKSVIEDCAMYQNLPSLMSCNPTGNVWRDFKIVRNHFSIQVLLYVTLSDSYVYLSRKTW